MPVRNQLVLDCSVAMAWCFIDEKSDYADAIAGDLARSLEAIVPSIWPLEVANVLLVGERRNRSSEADTRRWTTLLRSFPISVDDWGDTAAFGETVHLARTLQFSAYDASYLELALRLRLPFATLDEKLGRAAEAVGITRYEPEGLTQQIGGPEAGL